MPPYLRERLINNRFHPVITLHIMAQPYLNHLVLGNWRSNGIKNVVECGEPNALKVLTYWFSEKSIWDVSRPRGHTQCGDLLKICIFGILKYTFAPFLGLVVVRQMLDLFVNDRSGLLECCSCARPNVCTPSTKAPTSTAGGGLFFLLDKRGRCVCLRGSLGDRARCRGGGPPEFDPFGRFPHRCRRTWSLKHRRGSTSRFGALLGDLVNESKDLRGIASFFGLFSTPFDRLHWKRRLWERVEIVQKLEGLLLFGFRFRL